MTRTFISLPGFDKDWEEMGLGDNELRLLQEELIANPQKGDIIQGTGGLRKIRIAFEGKGKSGSGRVCYVDFAYYDSIYLIAAYPKSEKDNLTKGERNEIAKLVKALERSISGRKG